MLSKIRGTCFAALLASGPVALPPFDSAWAIETAGVKESPEPGTPGYEELAFAFARLAKGDYEGALRFAREARKLAPDYEMPTRVLADVLSRTNRPAEALEAINAYAAAHKPSPVLIAQRGYLRKKLADSPGAEADLRQARESGSLTKDQTAAADSALFDLAMDKAYKELAAGRTADAIKQAQIARRMDPRADAPVNVLMEGYAREGRREAALSEADLYLSQNKPTGRILAQRAYLRRAMKDLKGAQADFEAALATPDIEPDQALRLKDALAEARGADRDLAASKELEQVYKAMDSGDYARAIQAARDARAKNPKAEGPLFALMTALNRSGKPAAAVEEADAYLKDNPPSAVLLAQRGYSRRAAGDTKGAAEDFQAALAQPGLAPAQERQARLALAEAERAGKPGASAEAAPSGPTATPLEQALNRAYDAIRVGRLEAAAQAAREARELDPKAEEPTLVLMNVLTRQGRKAAAMSEADRYLAKAPHSAEVLAQRGYLRREAKNMNGAIADFSQALKSGGLSGAQRANVAKALDEARYTLVAESAFKASAAHDWAAALRYSRAAQAFARADEAMYRITVEALAGLGRKDEALKASNALIARGKASGQAYAQRGYLRAGDDPAGAASDFQTALLKGGLPPAQRVSVQRGLAISKATVFEGEGKMDAARSELANFTQAHPGDSDGWLAFGGLLSRQRDYPQALWAYENSLTIDRRGETLLNAGYASVYVDRSKESQFFREAIDRWSSDPDLSARPARDRDVVRNQIVEADASIRTNVFGSSFVDRPYRWGGRQYAPSFETVMRFDGRYLPYLFGLEAFIGGFYSQDQTRFAEGYSRLGMRVRPFDGINFSVSGEWQHYFVGGIYAPYNQFALSWGYGYGGFAYSSAPSAGAAAAVQPADIAYPLETGWQPLTSFATFGQYRSGEQRYLQNATGLLGYSYWDADSRFVLGPAGMAQASYDNRDLKPFAFGVGPSVVARLWVGGDYYRAYDGIITLQMGYLFPFGESHRLSGLNTTLGVTF